MPKISELPAATTVADADDLVVVQSGTTKRVDGVLVRDRSIPRIASTGETLAATANGHCYSTTGNMTIPASVFADGNGVSIYNRSGSAITLTQGSGLTLRLAGTATTGNRTLAQRGVATVWFDSATDAVIFGQGLT
jgi:hypothetical protein